MSTVATRSLRQPAGSTGDPMPGTIDRSDFTRQQEIQFLKDQYETQLRMQEDRFNKEKKAVKEEMKQLKNDNRVQKINNMKLRRKIGEMKEDEADLQRNLQQVKGANNNLNEYWESRMQACEEEKKILLKQKEELQAVMTNVRVKNLQLVGSTSQQYEGHKCGREEGKVSLDSFQFVKKLGQGAFGMVVPAKGRLPGGPEELYAIKAIKKQHITNSRRIAQAITEKEALIRTSGHPFITTLHSCFQNEDHIFYVMEYMSRGDLRGQLYKVEVFSERMTQF